MNEIQELIYQQKLYSVISNYSLKDVCKSLSFSEAMHLVEHLFYDDIRDDEKQKYALRLAFEIRDHFKEDWDRDWKNEVFLGVLCEMLCLYNERYLCFKRAYDKLENPPAELLLRLSGCNSTPDNPPITDEESEFYLKKAMEKRITFEAAFKMKILCLRKGDKSQAEHWDQQSKKLKEVKVFSDQLIPDVLK